MSGRVLGSWEVLTVYFTSESESGAHIWRLYGDNHKLVAWSGETFDSASNATRAANAFKVGAASARYEVYEDTAKKPRWRAWRSSDIAASSGESFSSADAAQEAADNVRDNAGTATGP